MPKKQKLRSDLERKPLIPVKYRCLWGTCHLDFSTRAGLEAHWVQVHNLVQLASPAAPASPASKEKSAIIEPKSMFDLREFEKR